MARQWIRRYEWLPLGGEGSSQAGDHGLAPDGDQDQVRGHDGPPPARHRAVPHGVSRRLKYLAMTTKIFACKPSSCRRQTALQHFIHVLPSFAIYFSWAVPPVDVFWSIFPPKDGWLPSEINDHRIIYSEPGPGARGTSLIGLATLGLRDTVTWRDTWHVTTNDTVSRGHWRIVGLH